MIRVLISELPPINRHKQNRELTVIGKREMHIEGRHNLQYFQKQSDRNSLPAIHMENLDSNYIFSILTVVVQKPIIKVQAISPNQPSNGIPNTSQFAPKRIPVNSDTSTYLLPLLPEGKVSPCLESHPVLYEKFYIQQL